MTYSTNTDVQNAAGGAASLAALADFDGDGVADATVIAAAQAAADGMINSYFAKRFAVPMSSPPADVVELAARLAVHRIRIARQTVTQGDTDQNALDIKWLEGVRDGKNVPGTDPVPAASALQVDTAGSRDSTKLTSRERLKGFW